MTTADDSLGVDPRTQIKRLPENAVDSRADLYRVLDDGLVAHVGFDAGDGHPVVIPCAYARRGDDLLLHGSRASRMFRALADGAPACVTVTLLDGLVYARSLFESSMNYRSAVIFGTATVIGDDDKYEALIEISGRLLPGRTDDVRPTLAKELAATMVLSIPLTQASVKASHWDGAEPDEDLSLPHWAGVLPLTMVAGDPVDSPDLAAGIDVPGYVTGHPLRPVPRPAD